MTATQVRFLALSVLALPLLLVTAIHDGFADAWRAWFTYYRRAGA
jgi:hypothetical protein